MGTRRHSPWLWIPSLCAAEEIPSAMVTFVSLLMFIQFGVEYWLASVYEALLFLPWVLKSYMRSKVRNAGYYKKHLHGVEFGMFAVLYGTALYITETKVNTVVLFLLMFVLAFLCAWHDLLARMYYNRMLYPRQQKLYNKTMMFASQVTQILTYGVLIIFVGFFEVFFRSVQKAWAMENYLVAGAFFIFGLINLFVLQNPRIHNPYRYESLKDAFKNELQIVERIRRRQNFWKVLFAFGVLMLPQSLLFVTRVFFLVEDVKDGGLGCSIQEVGFAFGTIGVIAFSLGIGFGRWLIGRFGGMRLFWWLSVPLSFSPVCYVLMSQNPLPENIPAICSMAFINQFCFGFGLNVCMLFVKYISKERYRNTIDYLYIPFVASVMVIPIAVSGCLSTLMGFRDFFAFGTAFAPVALFLLYILNIRTILENEK